MPGTPINKPYRAEESRMLKKLSWYILGNSKQMEINNKNKIKSILYLRPTL